MPKVAVIVVTHDSERFLTQCFASLGRALAGHDDVAVIAVDNASRDATGPRLRTEFPWVELLESPVNRGFAGGSNLGIGHALELGAEWVYLLNHDTEVTPGFLSEAVRVGEENDSIAAVQSLLLLDPERELVDSSGNQLHFLGFGSCRDYRSMRRETDLSDGDEIAFASGAGALLRCAALREVGLFDERFFLYCEDVDLGWRLRIAGHRAVLAASSVVYHRHEFSRAPDKFFLLERNRWFSVLKNASARSLLVLAPAHLAAELGLFVVALVDGWGAQKIRAWLALLRPTAWRYLAAERRRVQKLRRVPDREVAPLVTPEIVFEDFSGAFVRRVANPLMWLAWQLLRPLI